MRLEQVASMLKLSPPKTDVHFDGISIDSRTLQKNNLFVAINGNNFDGHKYIASAKAKGAAAAMVDLPSTHPELPELVVGDTRKVLGELAKAYLEKMNAKRVAITGSVGKTTVKEMVSAILHVHTKNQSSIIATLGNLNNDLGVPLTVFRVKPETEYGVFELGANHIGEIAYIADIVKPHIALVNNVAGVHLEGFGSIEGVAQGKSEIYQYLTTDDTAVINLDDAYSESWLEQTEKLGCKVITYSIANSSADVFASELLLESAKTTFVLNASGKGSPGIGRFAVTVSLALLGEHSCRNALAAASISFGLGVSVETIIEGLSKVGEVKGRFNIVEYSSGATLIDDTYNANGKSVKAAIDVVVQLKQQQNKKDAIVILGYLGELGLSEVSTCEDVAKYAITHNIDQLWIVGEQSSLYQSVFVSEELKPQESRTSAQFNAFDDVESAANALLPILKSKKEDVIVLVKGSRSAKMERIFQLLNDAENRDGSFENQPASTKEVL